MDPTISFPPPAHTKPTEPTRVLLSSLPPLSSPSPLTSRQHEQVLKAPLTHGGGSLAGEPLVVVVQNYNLSMGIFLMGGRAKGVSVNLW